MENTKVTADRNSKAVALKVDNGKGDSIKEDHGYAIPKPTAAEVISYSKKFVLAKDLLSAHKYITCEQISILADVYEIQINFESISKSGATAKIDEKGIVHVKDADKVNKKYILDAVTKIYKKIQDEEEKRQIEAIEFKRKIQQRYNEMKDRARENLAKEIVEHLKNDMESAGRK